MSVLLAAGNRLFQLEYQVAHVVGLVQGVFVSGPHVHHGTSVLVVPANVNFSGFVFFSKNCRKVLTAIRRRAFGIVLQGRNNFIDLELFSPSKRVFDFCDGFFNVSLNEVNIV